MTVDTAATEFLPHLIMIGVSHKTSAIEFREQFYFQPSERELLLEQLKNDPAVVEAILLSTCNRTEIYAQVIQGHADVLWAALCRVKKIALSSQLKEGFYAYNGVAAARHFFRVAAGLESMVVGEQQVLGQVKEAVDLSRQHGMMGREFNIFAQLAIRAGKKAQNETLLGCGGTSISWAAVVMAENLLGTLKSKSILVIGAGKMGNLAVRQLHLKGAQTIYLMNRSLDKAESLAVEFGCRAVPFWQLQEILVRVDGCICSAGAPHHIIEAALVGEVMAARRGRPLMLLDISIPRNIAPEVSFVEDVSLKTIDDLDQVLQDNALRRYSAVQQVEEIIEEKIQSLSAKLSAASGFAQEMADPGSLAQENS